MKYIQQRNGRKKKQVTPKTIGELQQNEKKIREQAFRLCGKTTLLLEGTQTPFVRERSCCKNVDNVFLSLDNRKAELYWKTTVALTNPFEGLVAQRTTRLTTNQKIAGSNPAKLGDRFLPPCFWCLVKQNKTTLSTDTRKTLLKPKEKKTNQRGHSLYFGD